MALSKDDSGNVSKRKTDKACDKTDGKKTTTDFLHEKGGK